MSDLPAGTVVGGRYQIASVLARGGSSTIYRAHPMHGAGLVAIKRLRDDADVDEIRHFEREFTLLQSLAHPGLPLVIEQIEQDGHLHLVEELVPGHTLAERMASEGPLPWRQALDIGRALLDVLAWLHRHDVVHRDLTPSNVMLANDGTVRLIDLGAARRWRPGLAHDTVPLGTPGYAAPEQYGRRQSDTRTDLYSLGALLHHLVSGIDPSTLAWRFPPLDACAPGVPAAFSSTVAKALSIDPAARPASAEEMGRSLVAAPQTATAPPARHSAPHMCLAHQKEGWGRQRRTEIHDEGLRICIHGHWAEWPWSTIHRLRETIDSTTGHPLRIQIASDEGHVDLLGASRALSALSTQVIARAGLRDDPSRAWRDSYVGTHARCWTRPGGETPPQP